MDTLLYLLARVLVKFFQLVPLPLLARIGCAGGGLAYLIDGRHRRVAIENLTRCFGAEKSSAEIRRLARENFKRLGENYLCAIHTAGLSWPRLESRLEFIGLDKLHYTEGSIVIAIGHFGNFELYARANNLFPQYQFATTYRALKQPGLNRVLVDLRTRSGCLLFERRNDSEALRSAMSSGRLMLGFLSDQHAGKSGAWVPFFGQPCSTTSAPAVFALRYKAPLHTAVCFRTGPARWRIEVGDAIPTLNADGERRSSEEIMTDVNRAFETAVRRDPANWFWVHKRWKPQQLKGAPKKPVAAQLNELGKT